MKADLFRQISKVVDGVETVLHTYTYGDSDWKDLLTAYDGYEITYDEIGNPESYYNGTRWTFDWEKGRQLVSAESDDCEIRYTYDLAGIRDSKTVDGVTYHYQTLNGKVVRQTWTEDGVEKVFDIIYDANGQPYACEYEGSRYYYVCNSQGDVIRILTTVGAKTIVEYQYDAWGNVISIEGILHSTLGKINPIRYRGYYYDTETGFYYLQSRYYDPSIGRFINADSFASTGQDFIGYNMFAYCGNNPVNHADPTGEFAILSTLAIVGIGFSMVVGGLVAGISTAQSNGSVGEIIINSTIGAVAAGGIALSAAVGAAASWSVGTVAAISAGIGVVAETASIATEYAFHKDDANYTFSWGAAVTRVVYSAGMSALSGVAAFGLNTLYQAEEMVGLAISAETTIACGAVDFATRQVITGISKYVEEKRNHVALVM